MTPGKIIAFQGTTLKDVKAYLDNPDVKAEHTTTVHAELTTHEYYLTKKNMDNIFCIVRQDLGLSEHQTAEWLHIYFQKDEFIDTLCQDLNFRENITVSPDDLFQDKKDISRFTLDNRVFYIKPSFGHFFDRDDVHNEEVTESQLLLTGGGNYQIRNGIHSTNGTTQDLFSQDTSFSIIEDFAPNAAASYRDILNRPMVPMAIVEVCTNDEENTWRTDLMTSSAGYAEQLVNKLNDINDEGWVRLDNATQVRLAKKREPAPEVVTSFPDHNIPL